MEHWKNLSLQNITEVFDEITYIEEWKDIEGYENLYQISNLGRVKTLGNGKGNASKIRIRKQNINRCNYLFLSLCKNCIPHPYTVHRLVAKAYIPNPENKSEVNHKKGNKKDNRFHQLEWNTSSENQKHAFGLGLKKSPSVHRGKFGKDHPTSRPVAQYTKEGLFIENFESIAAAKLKTGIKSCGVIYSCQRGRICQGKYIFKYLS